MSEPFDPFSVGLHAKFMRHIVADLRSKAAEFEQESANAQYKGDQHVFGCDGAAKALEEVADEYESQAQDWETEVKDLNDD